MIALGLVLLIVGLLAPALHVAALAILVPIGALILIVGVVLAALGHSVSYGGRRWY